MTKASGTGWPEHWPAWVVDILAELEAAEASEPSPEGMAGGPQWVDVLARQVMVAMNPKVSLTDPGQSGARFLGGVLGHQEWLRTSDEGVARQLERAEQETERAQPMLDFLDARLRARLSAEAYGRLMADAEKTERMVSALVDGGLRVMERKGRITQAALKRASQQAPEVQGEFFAAYGAAVRTPLYDDQGAVIHEGWWSVTLIYFAMVLFWRVVKVMPSVTALHGWLCLLYGKERVGSLDRVKQICKRYKVKLAKRGRPRKKMGHRR